MTNILTTTGINHVAAFFNNENVDTFESVSLQSARQALADKGYGELATDAFSYAIVNGSAYPIYNKGIFEKMVPYSELTYGKICDAGHAIAARERANLHEEAITTILNSKHEEKSFSYTFYQDAKTHVIVPVIEGETRDFLQGKAIFATYGGKYFVELPLSETRKNEALDIAKAYGEEVLWNNNAVLDEMECDVKVVVLNEDENAFFVTFYFVSKEALSEDLYEEEDAAVVFIDADVMETLAGENAENEDEDEDEDEDEGEDEVRYTLPVTIQVANLGMQVLDAQAFDGEETVTISEIREYLADIDLVYNHMIFSYDEEGNTFTGRLVLPAKG